MGGTLHSPEVWEEKRRGGTEAAAYKGKVKSCSNLGKQARITL